MLFEVLLTLVALGCLHLLWTRWRYDLHRIPSPPGLPVLGHTLEFVTGTAGKQVWLWFGNAFKELGYPPLLRVNLAGSSLLVVRDLSFIKTVMNSKTDPFPRSPRNRLLFLPLLGNDASVRTIRYRTSMNDYTKAYRRIFMNALSSSQLSKLLPKINALMDRLIDIMEAERQNGPIDVQDLFPRFSMDAIGMLAFDVDLGAISGSRPLLGLLQEVAFISRTVFSNPVKKMYFDLFPNWKVNKTYKHAIDGLNDEWAWLVRELRCKADPKDGDEPMWWQLRNLKDLETGQLIDDKSLRTEMAAIVLAGSETTSQQLSWILCLLASHPHVMSVLMTELKEKGLHRPDGKEITFQDLGDLSYLSAIIKEGMRIAYIVSSSLMRSVPRDMTILGYRVPKGTVISAAGTRCVELEEEWGDPKVFRPERWMAGEDMSEKYSFGFSWGPRDCVGQRLAMLEMKLGVIRLAQKYDLELEGDYRQLLDTAYNVIGTKAKGGIWINLTPRVVE